MRALKKQSDRTNSTVPDRPAAALPAKPPRSPSTDARLYHGFPLAGSPYRHQVQGPVGDDAAMLDSATTYVLDLLGEFKPRGPIERMLVSQMVHTHARVMYLNAFAHAQQNLKWATMMNDSADRAANTFRRQVLAVAEYRRPGDP